MQYTVNGRTIAPDGGILGENGRITTVIFQLRGVRGVPYIAYRNAAGGAGIALLDAKPDGDGMSAVWYAGREATLHTGPLTVHLLVNDPQTMRELLRTEPAVFTVAATVSEPSPQRQIQTPPEPVRARRAAQAAPLIQDPDSEPPLLVKERTITVPAILQTIAVQNDIRSETVKIQLPQFYDGEDLSRYSLILKCISAGGRTDIDLTPTMQADGETITLEWTLRPPETSFSGRLQIQLRAVDGDTYKWETFFTSVQIAESLDAEPVLPTEQSWLDEAVATVAGYVRQAKGSADDANASALRAEQAVQDAQGIVTAAEAARDTAGEHAAAADTARQAAEAAAALAQQTAGTLDGYVEAAQSAAADAEAARDAAQSAAADAETAVQKAEAAAQEAAQEAAVAAAEQTADSLRAELSGLTEQAEMAKTGAEAARDAAEQFAKEAESAAGGGVVSFNGRGGAVRPAAGDYSAGMITGLDQLIQAGSAALADSLPAGGLLLVIKGAAV